MDTRGRGDIHQMARAAGGQHAGQKSPRDMHHAHDIDGEYPIPRCGGRIEKRADEADAGIVDQHMRHARLGRNLLVE